MPACLPTYWINKMPIIEKNTEYPPCLTLKHHREKLGLSQKDLAMLLAQQGLATFGSNYISKFERGLQRPWKNAKIAIASALSISEDDLFPELDQVKK